MSRKKSQEEFVLKVYDLVKEEYLVNSLYEGALTKVEFIHKNCFDQTEHIFSMRPSDFFGTKNKKGSRCPKCFGRPKKTHEQFEKELNAIHNGKIVPLQEYQDMNTKISLFCKECNLEFKQYPSELIYKSYSCPNCTKKIRLKEYDYEQKLFDVHGDKYKPIEAYNGSKVKIKLFCNFCKKEFQKAPNDLLNGQGCVHCSKEQQGKNRSMSDQEFQARIKEVHSDKYSPLEPYPGNNRKRLKVMCNSCKAPFQITGDRFLQGQGCRPCGIKKRTEKRKKSNEQFLIDLRIVHGLEYEPLEKYGSSNKDPLRMKHNLASCGHIWMVTPNDILDGTGCPLCYGNELKTQDEFLKEIYRIHGDTIIIKSEYQSRKSRINVSCQECNHEWFPVADKILSGQGCPVCKESRGEKKIRLFLDKLKLKFERQKTFKECVNINPLPFDFVVYLPNGKEALIEYNGEQHYMPIEPWGGEDNFQEVSKRDKIKVKFCKENHISLIVIPYWDFDILEEVLLSKFAMLSPELTYNVNWL